MLSNKKGQINDKQKSSHSIEQFSTQIKNYVDERAE